MSATSTTRRRWTDTAIESELRTQTSQLGHFPTRSELVARGLRGLWDAMRASGGVEVWEARLENGAAAPTQDAVRPAPMQEEIAKLAYELYERGEPGDAVTHWLAAEQQLN